MNSLRPFCVGLLWRVFPFSLRRLLVPAQVILRKEAINLTHSLSGDGGWQGGGSATPSFRHLVYDNRKNETYNASNYGPTTVFAASVSVYLTIIR